MKKSFIESLQDNTLMHIQKLLKDYKTNENFDIIKGNRMNVLLGKSVIEALSSDRNSVWYEKIDIPLTNYKGINVYDFYNTFKSFPHFQDLPVSEPMFEELKKSMVKDLNTLWNSIAMKWPKAFEEKSAIQEYKFVHSFHNLFDRVDFDMAKFIDVIEKSPLSYRDFEAYDFNGTFKEFIEKGIGRKEQSYTIENLHSYVSNDKDEKNLGIAYERVFENGEKKLVTFDLVDLIDNTNIPKTIQDIEPNFSDDELFRINAQITTWYEQFREIVYIKKDGIEIKFDDKTSQYDLSSYVAKDEKIIGKIENELFKYFATSEDFSPENCVERFSILLRISQNKSMNLDSYIQKDVIDKNSPYVVKIFDPKTFETKLETYETARSAFRRVSNIEENQFDNFNQLKEFDKNGMDYFTPSKLFIGNDTSKKCFSYEDLDGKEKMLSLKEILNFENVSKAFENVGVILSAKQQDFVAMKMDLWRSEALTHVYFENNSIQIIKKSDDGYEMKTNVLAQYAINEETKKSIIDTLLKLHANNANEEILSLEDTHVHVFSKVVAEATSLDNVYAFSNPLTKNNADKQILIIYNANTNEYKQEAFPTTKVGTKSFEDRMDEINQNGFKTFKQLSEFDLNKKKTPLIDGVDIKDV